MKSMHMARRAAAWVAWAAWTCKSTGANGFAPRAPTGYGLKRAGFGPLFFLRLASQTAVSPGRRALASSSRRLPPDPAVAIRILEGRVASPGLLLDFGELQSSTGQLLVIALDVGDVEHDALQSTR